MGAVGTAAIRVGRGGIAVALAFVAAVSFARAEPKHAIAMHGEPALAADFSHFPSANPDASKGGSIAFAGEGTFDSLNPFIVKGAVPEGLWGRSNPYWSNNVWESLLIRNWDEPFTLYGHLAEFVETPEDRSWVEFTMNPRAHFSDGMPVTTADVAFSFELLKEKGTPQGWHDEIASVEEKGEGRIRFVFGDGFDRELPLIVGLMPIFPKHATDAETFDQTTLQPLIGSGPYTIAAVNAGKTVTLKRDPNYWGVDQPAKRGFDNFDEVRIEYFRDSNSLFEAFKRGLYDLNVEADPARWAAGYTFPAVADGRVVLEEFESGTPKGMNGFVFNLRNPLFQDVRVREALGYFLDFEWINRNLYSDKYRRTGSYFAGSELSALGRPASERERELLAPFASDVRADIMDGTWAPPVSDGSGRDRNNLRKAVELLREAGYEVEGGQLVHKATGAPFAFEFLARDAGEERLALAFQRSLSVAGISMSVRLVDTAQYWDRLKGWEFDMMHFVYGSSLSPGNEQIGRWSKIDAETFGRLNFAGVSSPAVDAMIDAMLAANTREEFVDAVRAFDRVLLSGFYVVPLFHAPTTWIARWRRVTPPEYTSLYGPQPMTWWSEE